MNFNVREDIIQMTPCWKGERFPDGRPRVPDRYLKTLHKLTLEEVWKPVYLKGYINQFEGELKLLHQDGRKLIGRAVTSVFCPIRPDLDEAAKEIGKNEGRNGTYNQWVIDSLVEGDVCIADMYDKIYKGTFLGGNLTTAVANRTKNGGAVIWGGIRDLEQMKQVEEVQVYYRGTDPTPIREFVMTGFNVPVRIGKAVCLPGDIVFGRDAGVLFIPAHLVEEVIEGAAKTKAKDMFGFAMISQNRFTTAEIDKNIWSVEMLDMLVKYIEENESAAEFRAIDWSEEYRLAGMEDADQAQSAM